MDVSETCQSKNNHLNDDIDHATKIVSKVIDEYDVIDDPQKDAPDNRDNDIHDLNETQRQTSAPKPVGTTDKKGNSSCDVSNRNRLSSSERSNSIAESAPNTFEYPKVNSKEKIIICIDVSAEMEKPSFRSRAGEKLSPKQILKKAMGLFLQSKSRLDKKHEYALILLQETAVWARDFTNNPRDIQVALEDIVDTPYYESCDASTIFDKIADKVDIPPADEDISCLPPPHIVRLLLIYGRNNCPLQFQKLDSFKLLTSSPYFFLDVLYIHEPQTEENKCQEVFDSICDLDTSGLSYIHSTSRNPTKVYDYMSQLLAHPLQRPLQEETVYRIGSSIPTPENG